MSREEYAEGWDEAYAEWADRELRQREVRIAKLEAVREAAERMIDRVPHGMCVWGHDPTSPCTCGLHALRAALDAVDAP